ncbi:MAG: glycosyltransferase family 39 protein [Lysobacteraceae bacterium]
MNPLAGQRSRNRFVTLWAVLLAAKVALAVSLPLFVDEAFYWWEGQQLAWAYSDLPGLTAWLARMGVSMAGNSELGLRWPFLLIGAASSLLVVRIAGRVGDPSQAWRAGCWALLLPLFATLGLLALPDVPLLFATLLCVDGWLGLRESPRSRLAALCFALGLMLGALAHYRFGLVLVAGAAAILLDARSRSALRYPLPWLAALAGAMAWLPLLRFNLRNAEAGWRFQLVERHPWSFDFSGIWQLPMQALLVTPLLFALLLATLWWLWRRGGDELKPKRFLSLCAGLLLLGLFVIGFFADRERVSFHWPLPAWVLLCVALPLMLDRIARPWLARVTAAIAIFGVVLAFLVLGMSTTTSGRAWLVSNDVGLNGFSGWHEAAAMLRRQPEWPALERGDVELVAGDFKLGAQMAFALGQPRIPVLDHPINHKHGRALQLALWDLEPRLSRQPTASRLLLIRDDGAAWSERNAFYVALCAEAGGLRLREVLPVDGGAQRFVLLEQVSPEQGCEIPPG